MRITKEWLEEHGYKSIGREDVVFEIEVQGYHIEFEHPLTKANVWYITIYDDRQRKSGFIGSLRISTIEQAQEFLDFLKIDVKLIENYGSKEIENDA